MSSWLLASAVEEVEAEAAATETSPPLDPFVQAIVDATQVASTDIDHQAQEAYGDWCKELRRAKILDSLRGLRARKLAWWFDSEKPLRAVLARTLKYEISVIALPGGVSLPSAALPRGSLIFCQPLLGQFEVRRLRYDITGKTEAPMELMKRVLRQGGATQFLSGGSCHDFKSTPGLASAFLQVALLPPTSRLADTVGAASGDGPVGWRRPPGEACHENLDVVSNVAIGVELDDLLVLERPSAQAVELDRLMDTRPPSGTRGMPDTAGQLTKMLGDRVGGLDAQLGQIVRRAVGGRLYPPALTRSLGISPVRGMLLYGPPGCGKTLLAREIAAALQARAPKIVNGPEMMSRFVGDSEEFVRALFAEAELEQAEEGDDSALHVIVFDEMDAFTRERGSLAGDTSGIRDSVVNQLLAKMDGVDALDNVLVIGLTNRPELMDPALLRPGRLEVQVRPTTGLSGEGGGTWSACRS